MEFGSNSKFKGLMIISIGISVAIIIFIFGWFNLQNNRTAKLILRINGHERIFEGKTKTDMTILEALYASSLAGGIGFTYTIDPIKNEAKIMTLDGYDYNSKNKLLNFYLNSDKIEADKIHSTVINPGDVIVVGLE